MKIIESQSAVLSNFEVYQHVAAQRDAYKKNKRRGPPNLETVVRELLQYLRTAPNPLSQEPLTYTPECIGQMLERLRPYDLAKGEVIMILNLRPSSVPALNTVIEDMAERFDYEQQEAIVQAIADVLGAFPAPAEAEGEAAEGEEEADASMAEATAA